MAGYQITCPGCRAVLRSSQPLPGAQQLRCPGCGCEFPVSGTATEVNKAPASAVAPVLSLPSPPSPAGGMAAQKMVLLLGAFLLVGGLLGVLAIGAVALVLSRRTGIDAKDAAVAEHQNEKERAAEKEREDKVKQEKRQKDYLHLMVRAASDLKDRRYVEAEKGYEDALALLPGDEDARKGLDEARAGLKVAREKDGKARDDGDKAAEFAKLMEEGKQQLVDKNFSKAVLTFQAAIALQPTRSEARDGLLDAQQGISSSASEKKKKEEYDAHLSAGRDAMVAERYDDALREFAAALRLIPDDAAASQGRQLAEKRLGNIQDQKQRQVQYDRTMERARTSLASNRYEEAIQGFEDAGRLVPGDRAAKLALEEARRKRGDARQEADRLVSQGDTAVNLGLLDDAVRSYELALQALPDYEIARTSLQKARDRRDTYVKLQATYLVLMDRGGRAMEARRFQEALLAYNDAVALLPLDRAARDGLRDAKKACEAEDRKRIDFDKQMQVAEAAMRARKYSEAIGAYNQALQLCPDDDRATSGKNRASYSMHMSTGQVAMGAHRYHDAVAEFDAALQDQPGDANATGQLRMAKSLDKQK